MTRIISKIKSEVIARKFRAHRERSWRHYYKPSSKHNSGLHEVWSHDILRARAIHAIPPGGTSRDPYPISDQNVWFSLPYFRPDKKFDTLFQICLVISSLGQTNVKGNEYTLLLSRLQNRNKLYCYDTCTVGVNIKREMGLSPNDEEVASSKKTHTIQD